MHGNEFLYIIFEKHSGQFSSKLITSKLSQSYSSLSFKTSASINDLIGVRFLSKSIDLIKLSLSSSNELTFELCQTVETVHNLEFIQIFLENDNLLSFGFDGTISVWDINSMKINRTYLAYNKYNGGVSRAICNVSGR